MALPVVRIYKNAAADVLRVDTISMEATTNQLTSGVSPKTYTRRISISRLHETSSARVVAGIQIITTADTIETVSGDYTNVQWTTINAGQTVICNMSDLPGIGDSV